MTVSAIKALAKAVSLSRLFVYLNGLPWTKPVAIIICFVDLGVFVLAFGLERDIPPNAAELGKWLGASVFAIAAGKSAYEGGRRPGHGEDDPKDGPENDV